MQAVWQTVTLFVTLGVGIAGGILCGMIMLLLKRLRRILARDFFNDRTFWNLPSDYEHVVNATKDGEDDNSDKKSVDVAVVEDRPMLSQRKPSNSSITSKSSIQNS